MIPPVEEQERIVQYLDEYCLKFKSVLNTKQLQLDVLKQNKQSTVYEYVTGKKRVKEVM